MFKDDSNSSIGSLLLLALQFVLGIGLLWLCFLWLAALINKDTDWQIQFAAKATARAILLLMALIAVVFIFDGEMGEPYDSIVYGYPLVLIGFVVLMIYATMIEKLFRG